MTAAHDIPLSQLESMTLGYIPLFVVACFFWWLKPKDVKTPSIVDLPEILSEQKPIFESTAVSNAFDDERTEQQDSRYSIWKLTPPVLEKEAADEARRGDKRDFIVGNEARHLRRAESLIHAKSKEIVVTYWDPDLYHSKIWLLTCLFGASFRALHFISWNCLSKVC